MFKNPLTHMYAAVKEVLSERKFVLITVLVVAAFLIIAVAIPVLTTPFDPNRVIVSWVAKAAA